MHKEQTITLPIYFQAIKSLREAQEDTFELIFQRLSQAWPSSIIEEDEFQEGGAILEERLRTCASRLLAKTHHYLIRHKRQLLRTYLLLKLHIEDESLDANTLPSAVNAIVTSQFREYFQQPQNTAFLYLVCSIFMPMFIRLMQTPSPQPLELMLSCPQSICYLLSFAQMNSLYINEGLFLRMILERPLRILSNFPTLHEYDLYSRINFNELLDDSSCLVSSCLVNQKIITLVETFNFSKIVLFSDVITGRRPLTNNALLNSIERLDIEKIFSQSPNTQQEIELSSKSLCLTVPITKKVFGKMGHFFESLPPQLVPLSKYDTLSFGSGEESNTFLFRFATEEYWEHCPQSQFMEVYYLCNDSVVEWISLPSEEYRRSGKIRFWSEAEIRAICSPRYQACRGIQRKGDFVVVGQGHEHFWRVSKGYGMAVLAKWSILLKSKSQLTKFMETVREKERQQFESSWRLEIPHRRILFSFLAHEHKNLDGFIKKKMVSFIMGKVAYEENSLVKLCRSYQQRLTLKKSTIPSKFRLCGICGREIMNICGRVSRNIICLECLSDEISVADYSKKFEVRYICKPSAFTNFFRDLQSSPSESAQSTVNQTQRYAFYEENFCQGRFLGCQSSQQCVGQSKASEVSLQDHISNVYPSLQIHIFAKRNYFCTIEAAFKCFCLKKCEGEEERAQTRMLLGYISRSFLNREQRQQIRDCICRHYHENNYVTDGIRILAEGEFDA